jgi:hypothetical protein
MVLVATGGCERDAVSWAFRRWVKKTAAPSTITTANLFIALLEAAIAPREKSYWSLGDGFAPHLGG